MTGLGARDARIVHACWSLGYATNEQLRSLVSPDSSVRAVGKRTWLLSRAGYLVTLRYVCPTGRRWLLGAGPTSRPPGSPAPWRPGLAQLQHTLEVGDAVAALTRPGFAGGLAVKGWQGESELRGWAAPGAPYPDARVTWESGGAEGSWAVEVDRATESRAAWRRKLARYLLTGWEAEGETVLVLTTTRRRAGQIALVAADMGVPLLAGVLAEAVAESDPSVLDTRTRTRRALSETTG